MEKILQFLNKKWLFCLWLLWWLRSKVFACNAGEEGLIPVLERSLEKEMSTHSRILEWEWTEEPRMLRPQGCKRVEHNLVTKQQQNSKSSFVNTQLFPFFTIFICEPFLKSLLNLLEFFFFSVEVFTAMMHVGSSIPHQESNQHLLCWKAKSLPLDHQGSLSGFSILTTSLEVRNSKATATGNSWF